jgi:hypothetical protein
MRRIRTIWIGLAVVYAALLAWHQPLRGPLSEDEVRMAFGVQYEEMRLSEDAQARAFLDFFLNDDGRPFHMVNLNALPERTAETDEAAQAYGTFMAPRLLARASYPVLTTDVIVGLTNTLGPGVENADRLVVVRYRSRRDFLNIISTPEFRAAVEDKSISLDGWYSAPASIGPTLSVPLLALSVLIAVGGVGTALARRRQQTPRPQTPEIRTIG